MLWRLEFVCDSEKAPLAEALIDVVKALTADGIVVIKGDLEAIGEPEKEAA